MAFPLILIGLLMIVTGARGTYAQFGSQLASEFTGTNSFTYWLLALGIIGALGYIKQLQLISRMLMALIIISLFLAHKGFFAQFQSALSAGPTQPNALPSGSSTSATAAASNAQTTGQTGSIPFWQQFFVGKIAPTGSVQNPF
jgi:hypothetical protein